MDPSFQCVSSTFVNVLYVYLYVLHNSMQQYDFDIKLFRYRKSVYLFVFKSKLVYQIIQFTREKKCKKEEMYQKHVLLNINIQNKCNVFRVLQILYKVI